MTNLSETNEISRLRHQFSALNSHGSTDARAIGSTALEVFCGFKIGILDSELQRAL